MPRTIAQSVRSNLLVEERRIARGESRADRIRSLEQLAAYCEARAEAGVRPDTGGPLAAEVVQGLRDNAEVHRRTAARLAR